MFCRSPPLPHTHFSGLLASTPSSALEGRLLYTSVQALSALQHSSRTLCYKWPRPTDPFLLSTKETNSGSSVLGLLPTIYSAKETGKPAKFSLQAPFSASAFPHSTPLPCRAMLVEHTLCQEENPCYTYWLWFGLYNPDRKKHCSTHFWRLAKWILNNTLLWCQNAVQFLHEI